MNKNNEICGANHFFYQLLINNRNESKIVIICYHIII